MPDDMLWYDDYNVDRMVLCTEEFIMYSVLLYSCIMDAIIEILFYFVDLLRKCPYNIWEDSDISCKMFPDSTDSEICTTIGEPPDEGMIHK